MSKAPENTLLVLSLVPVTEIKSSSGVSLYPDSSSQRGVEAGGDGSGNNNNNGGGGSDDLRPASCQRSARGGAEAAAAHAPTTLLLRNKDRLTDRMVPLDNGDCQDFRDMAAQIRHFLYGTSNSM